MFRLWQLLVVAAKITMWQEVNPHLPQCKIRIYYSYVYF